MEGQGKRLLLAVGLALGVYMLWMVVFPPEQPKPNPTDGSGSAAVMTHKPAESGVLACEPAKLEATVQPDAVALTFPGKVTATFSKWGGTLSSWKLGDPRYEKDPMKGELLPPQAQQHGAFGVGFWQGSNRCLPAKAEWQLKKVDDKTVEATVSHAGMTFTKTFVVDPDTFSIRMKLRVVAAVSKGDFQQSLAITSYAFNDPKVEVGGGMQVAAREWSSATLNGEGELLATHLKDIKDPEKGTNVPRFEPNITWTGFEHPYLLVAFAPKRQMPTEQIAKHTYPLEPYGVLRTDIHFGPVIFNAKQTEITREVFAYLGPKNYHQLKDADEIAGFEVNFASTIDLGWFAFIGRPLMWLLLKFYSFVGNWALAIIMLTFLVKGATLYWTTKSMRSMKQMAALAPQMKALQDKYKNDRQRIQAETMALYKQHNVNPVAGCLPILLQMPIWIALYRMLSSAGELYHEAFIPGWIDDLTNTDPFHILPVILLVTMFVQARLTPVSGDSRQQKIMLYGMPLMFGVMSFFFPAGLTLYIFTNTCLSALHSIYMNKYDKKSIAIAAQLKKNAEEAKAAAEAKDKKPADKKAASKVIDVDSTDSDDEAGEGKPASRPHQQRKRSKKRRR
jgi:YidC/Oxa1 family membrane protein insertase